MNAFGIEGWKLGEMESNVLLFLHNDLPLVRVFLVEFKVLFV